MLNGIWIAMIFVALVCGAALGKLDQVTLASVEWAGKGVTIALSLVGIMAFWLGMMRVLQDGGLMRTVARWLRPVMTRLFPDVPPDHPAMSMMILNITANALGLANAATPFGLKAMIELNKLNTRPGVATNAMALFLAINTSNVALLPSGMISLRTGLGSKDPGSIIMTTLLATTLSTLVAIAAALLLQRLRVFAGPAQGVGPGEPAPRVEELDTREAEAAVSREVEPIRSLPKIAGWTALVTLAVCAFGTAFYSSALEVGWAKATQSFLSGKMLVVLMVAIILYGMYKRVMVYDALVTGGKEGFQVALRIIPYLVAILVAVGMLQAAGAIDLMAAALNPVTSLIGVPAEALPMWLLRPLTGNGAYGVAAGIMQIHGPDSLIGQIVSTMQGSTETTFYVLALYFGVVGIKNARHTVLACLAADIAGPLAAVWACRWLLT